MTFSNDYFEVHDDGYVSMWKNSSALDGASVEELEEFRDALDEALERKRGSA